MKRILLSVPHMGGLEEGFVREAFATNWLSTVGPNLTAFEQEFTALIGQPSVALGSGTAAIHLGLRLLGVGPGDDVIVSDLTFVASVNPIAWLGGQPVFVDSDRATWNLDPQRLEDALQARVRSGRALPKAVLVVHLYGQSADIDAILEVCARYGIPMFEDAAEALGTTYKGRPAGSFGEVNAFSFNGNKIITTTGGGMLTARRQEWVDKARFWSQQARDPRVEYHHTEMGYNYRLSNVLAGIGRGQLRVLHDRVAARRRIAFAYRDALADLPGIALMPQAPYGIHTNWLSVFWLDPARSPISRDGLIAALDQANIESRPVWKPMHLQPLWAHAEHVGGEVAADLYAHGICLPSSSSLSDEDQAHVIGSIRRAFGA
jgi:pyridoxal phosphate-dependent aminotransferase EpsN